MKENANMFRHYQSLGFKHILPIIPPEAPLSERSSLYKRLHAKKPRDERGKAPGKCYNGFWSSFPWQNEVEVEPDVWQRMGAGLGVKLGPVFDGDERLPGFLIALDADTYDIEHAKIVKAIVDRRLGAKLPMRIGRKPKALYLFRTEEDFRHAPIVFGDADERGFQPSRVEFLTAGKQFVAEGVHPYTKQPYEWVRPLVAAKDLPFVPADELQALIDEIKAALPNAKEAQTLAPTNTAPVPPELRRADLEVVQAAVDALPNTSEFFPDRNDYIRIMYAVRGALPDHPYEAFDIVEGWCHRWVEGENEPEIIRRDWDGMKEEPRIGFPTLLAELRRCGRGDVASAALASQHFDRDEGAAAQRRHEERQAKIAAGEIEESTPSSGENSPNVFEQRVAKFVFEPFYEAAGSALTTAAAPLIKGLLDQGAMSVVYGQSNVGKTFLTVDMAYHVATGTPYAGMRTTRGHVVYLSAEGGRSITKRLAALALKHGNADPVDLLLLRSTVDLRRPDADLKPLAVAIKRLGVPVALIVVDTLSRALAGGDENSSVDMGNIVNNFDKLRDFTQAHLMVVHHSGKNQAAGARGHSLLRAATDTEIEVADGLIEAKKQRDLDKNWSSGFVLDVVTLGVDGDGDPVTSCTVRLVSRHEGADVAVGALTYSEEKVVAAVAELEAFAEDENEGVSVAELTEFLVGKIEDLSANSLRQNLKRAVQKGALTKCRRGRWKTRELQSGQESGQNVFA